MREWTGKLDQGRPEAAWELFLRRYRRLLLATIRHYAHDPDAVMDAFTWVCDALRENDLARLRRYTAGPPHRARFSTWLVAVVRNLTIDWYRHNEGRRRLAADAARLPRLRRRIFEYVFLEQRSHVEAYELIRSRDNPELSFRAFLAELRETYRAVLPGRGGNVLRELGRFLPEETNHVEPFEGEWGDRRAALERALRTLPEVDRVAVLLYVVEDVPASDVARILGLPNAKAVYNRVYRTLATVRDQLSRAGLGREDL
ncbi:MAG TPA: sigma-70 family RNA polymerase sigma factor [Gemmatimonadaceae bacterium]